MSLKRYNTSSQPPIDTTIARPAKKTKKGTIIVLPDEVLCQIMPYVDSETLPDLTCAGKTTRDAAAFGDVANGSFSPMPTTERHFVEFAKKDGYNMYFQDLFASSRRSRVSPHLKWEAWFALLGDIGTWKAKVPMGVTAGVLRLLKYGSVAQLEALAKQAWRDKGFDDPVFVLEAKRRM
jgi:hypothetical protein